MLQCEEKWLDPRAHPLLPHYLVTESVQTWFCLKRSSNREPCLARRTTTGPLGLCCMAWGTWPPFSVCLCSVKRIKMTFHLM